MDTPVFGNVADYAEEQRGELEALESIFGSDLKVLKVESTSSSFTIKLVPYSDSTSKNYVGVTLHCTYTPVYPDELPDLKLTVDKGLTPEQLVTLEGLMKSTGQDCMGMPMIFTIASAVKDWLVANNVDSGDGSMFAQMMASMKRAEKQASAASGVVDDDAYDNDEDRQQARRDKAAMDAEVERERRRVLGTPVTLESFLAWRTKFEAELASQKKPTFEDEVAGKPSGRELFEKGGAAFLAAANSAEAAGEAEEDEAAAAGTEAEVVLTEVPIDASVFLEGSLSDIDDDEDDEYVPGEDEDEDEDFDEEDD